MGKATRWFLSLLGYRKSLTESSSAPSPEPLVKGKKKKSKWGVSNQANTFAERSVNGLQVRNVEDPLASPYVEAVEANKHAIAVAAATAAVAEAALAAAQAAAEVVRLTNSGASGRSAMECLDGDRRRVVAAVKIQSVFRAYLARKAFRALKGLVKLQALVRGRIVRKQSNDMLHRMQAMARIQARASARRSCISNSSKYSHPGTVNLQKSEPRSISSKQVGSPLKQCNSRSGSGVYNKSSNVASNQLDQWMKQCTWNNHQDVSTDVGCNDDKILEIDTGKPRQDIRLNERMSPISQYFSAWNDTGQQCTRNNYVSRLSSKLHKPNRGLSSKLHKPNPSISSEDVFSGLSPMLPREGYRVAAWTAQNSPKVKYASSRTASNRRASFTPTRSECSRSVIGDYLGHPNYMANTESSLAKVRSQSLPKQRMQLEEVGIGGKFGHVLWESDIHSEKGSILLVNRTSKGYLYSSHLKRQGTPTHGAGLRFSNTYGHML